MPSEAIQHLPHLPTRPAESHKGDYGRVLIVGGSRGMSGAVCLAGKAALRGGAGLVRVAVPASILPIVASYEPSYLTAALLEDDEGRIRGDVWPQIEELARANDVMAVGPGLGTSPELVELASGLYTAIRSPVVIDADGLNNLARRRELLGQASGPRILTPHPGEFARLIGQPTAEVQKHRQDCSVEFAQRHGVILVLKGHESVVTDGQRVWINPTGNSGMATGGTGDVLTGLIAAFLGQKLQPFEAAQLGVYVHGLAGDLAALDRGPTAMIASDLLDFLPRAVQQAMDH